jgi:hypothetical protein
MKQTTKVLLPLGLFMSIVIPLTVKALFTDTDFFESSENSKVDYLQPYKVKPESSIEAPQLNVGEDGLEVKNVGETSNPSTNDGNSYYKSSKEKKRTHSHVVDASNSDLDLDVQVNNTQTLEELYK